MTPKPISGNTLFYGDNLTVLRDHIPDESVDLVYLDPPFNSNRSYNVLFKDESGMDSEAQITAFEDTWHWGPTAEETYHALIADAPERVSAAVGALRQLVGTNQMMAYLVMMAARLVELHRVLKPTGSLYLHCDPQSSHYLKVILDCVFGGGYFRNEIVWKRSDAHNDARQGARQYGRIHDVLLFYTKGNTWTWNTTYTPLPDSTKDKWYRHIEEETGRFYNMADLTAAKAGGDTLYEWKGVKPPTGRYWAYSREKMEKLEKEGRIVYSSSGRPYMKRYLDESKGISLQDWWSDIEMLRGISSKERLGYPTQKPIALLERIVAASSNPGDVVLDPFCGCGTAIAAAQKFGRQWIGIDVTHLSISLMKYRLKNMYDLDQRKDYAVIGEPEDVGGARQLAGENRYQFQWWSLSLVKAKPLGGEAGSKQGKKGSDKGIDGVIPFIEGGGKPRRVLVQVKSGHVNSGLIRDLRGTVEREDAAIGVFITLDEPSRDMVTEAVSAGYYESPGWGKKFQKIQILTINDLLTGKGVDAPPMFGAFKQAERVQDEGGDQLALDI